MKFRRSLSSTKILKDDSDTLFTRRIRIHHPAGCFHRSGVDGLWIKKENQIGFLDGLSAELATPGDIKPMEFHSIIDAINFLTTYGYEHKETYVGPGESYGHAYHILRKKKSE